MPDLSAVTDNVTRKIGPLPLWGWALAVVGGYMGYRVLSGRSAFASSPSSGAPASSVTPTNDVTLNGDTANIITGLQTSIAGLGTSVTNLTSANGLLTRLNTAINARASALSTRDRNQRALSDAAIRYRDKKITKAQYDKLAKTYNSEITKQTGILAELNTLIADLQRQLAAIGA